MYIYFIKGKTDSSRLDHLDYNGLDWEKVLKSVYNISKVYDLI